MKKIALILILIAIASTLIACTQTEASTFEQRVIEDACKELNADTQGASIELVSSEWVAWLDCYTYNYIITLADGTRWLVGARENADGFYCDVECEING